MENKKKKKNQEPKNLSRNLFFFSFPNAKFLLFIYSGELFIFDFLLPW